MNGYKKYAKAKIELFFTVEEMIEILENNGYTIEIVDSWRGCPQYENDIDYENIKLTVAYLTSETEKIKTNLGLNSSCNFIEDTYGLVTVFTKFYKNKIKQTLLK